MSDPFSVAGSTVGVISLGLQICGQLVTYCRSLRDADQDLQNIANKAAGLRVPLKTLRDIIEDNENNRDSDVLDDMQDKVTVILEAIQRLQTTVERYRPAAAPSGVYEKSHAQYRKIIYPFRKDALRDLLKDLEAIQMNLHTSLHVYSTRNVRFIPLLIETQKQMHQELNDLTTLVRNNALSQGQVGQQPSGYVESNEDDLAPMDKRNQLPLVTPRSRRLKHTRTTAVKQYHFHSRLLGLFISASFSFTRGAGGCSISPTLCFYCPGPKESPLFGILGSIGEETLENEVSFNSLMSTIQQLFSEKTATPFDISRDGETPVSFLCFTSAVVTRFRNSTSYSRFHQLLEFLTENGSPVDSLTPLNWTSLNFALRYAGLIMGDESWQISAELMKYLVDHGSYVSVLQHVLESEYLQALQYLLAYDEDAFRIPDVEKAILRRSGEDFKAILMSRQCHSNKPIQYIRLLEMSIGWPEGLEILLDMGATNMWESEHGVWHALNLNCYESLRLVLKAGCPVRYRDIINAASSTDPRIQDTLISELASRRRNLQVLAQSYLLPQSNDESDSLPDVTASVLFDALSAKGLRLDPSLRVQDAGNSFYHFAFGCELPTMEKMYAAGFRDVDRLGPKSKTPLMEAPGISLKKEVNTVKWLVSKRANLFRTLPQSTATAAHSIACSLVFCIAQKYGYSYPRMAKYLGTKNIRFLKFIIQAPIEDRCLCSCSLGGCTPQSMALQQRVAMRTSGIPMDGWMREVLRFLVASVVRDTLDSHLQVIRFLTFDALGLTHSCCRKVVMMYQHVRITDRDPAEAQEIREEEAALLDDFETLLADLGTRFKELGVPILEFLEGYWYRRVMDHLLHRDRYDEGHWAGARALGVCLEPYQATVPQRVSLLLGPKVQEL